MKTQISRYLMDSLKQYTAVYQQQGRMLTDADWNSLVDVLKDRTTRALARVIGSGAPADNGIVDLSRPGLRPGGVVVVDGHEAELVMGWEVALDDGATASEQARNAFVAHTGVPVPEDLPPGEAMIRKNLFEFEARRIEAAVLSADENAKVRVERSSFVPGDLASIYENQAAFPNPPPLPSDGNYTLYADVWERPVLAIEDPSLLDAGLHGADTTTRAQTVVQVKWVKHDGEHLPSLAPPGDADHPLTEVYDTGKNPRVGNLLFSAEERTESDTPDPNDPCAVEVDLDEGSGNYLLRVEVHDVRVEGTSRVVHLKWSKENASEVHVVGEEPAEFRAQPSVLEFFDDAADKHQGVHLATPDAAWEPSRGELADRLPERLRPFVRRWDGDVSVVIDSDHQLRLPTDSRAVGRYLGGELTVGSTGEGGVMIENGEELVIHLDTLKWRLRVPNGGGDDDPPGVVAGDYWLAVVREHAPMKRRVHVPSELPVAVRHHYLPLFHVSGDSPHPLPDELHRRKLSFPPFADVGLEGLTRLQRKVDRFLDGTRGLLKAGGNPGNTGGAGDSPSNGKLWLLHRSVENQQTGDPADASDASIRMEVRDDRAIVDVGDANRAGRVSLLRGYSAGEPPDETVRLDGNSATAHLGRNNTAGELRLYPAKAKDFTNDAASILAKGDLALVQLRDSGGETTISLGGSEGAVWANSLRVGHAQLRGSNGSGGVLQFPDGSSVNRLRLYGGDNSSGSNCIFRDTGGKITIYLDGETGSIQAIGPISGDLLTISSGSDVAESFPAVEEPISPGTVVAISPIGLLAPSQGPYSTRVIGVITGAGDLQPALLMGKRTSDSPNAEVALCGTVYCWATAEEGDGACPIEAGDLLTTSPVAGHAMTAVDRARCVGALVGKALEPLSGGRGLVRVVVMLA